MLPCGMRTVRVPRGNVPSMFAHACGSCALPHTMFHRYTGQVLWGGSGRPRRVRQEQILLSGTC